MLERVVITDEYCAEWDSDKSVWAIRNTRETVVGYYSAEGIIWNEHIDSSDKDWLPEVLAGKLSS